MKKYTILVVMVGVILGGCASDNSMSTRQVSPPPPAGTVPGKPNLPPQAQAAISKSVAPPPSGPAAQGGK